MSLDESRTRPSVFVGGPFKNIIDAATGVVRTDQRRRIEAVIDHFESAGFDVYNAHRREQWGACMLTPDECTRLDYEEIRDADLFVAFPGEPASPGTHIEIGWASGMGKPVILLVDDLEAHCFLVRGLPTVADVRFVEAGDVDRMLLRLEDAVRAALPATATVPTS